MPVKQPEKHAYKILTDASHVAGRRNIGQGKSILLSEEEARYALIAKHIRKTTDLAQVAEPLVEPEPVPVEELAAEKPKSRRS